MSVMFYVSRNKLSDFLNIDVRTQVTHAPEDRH